jgi:cellulose synthase/poly-beta-1,6-N-acetylglucosamine synthase-like glycosyltransferase
LQFFTGDHLTTTEFLFIGLTALLIYIWLGYPLLLLLLAKLFPRPHRWNDGYEPSVTLIISAYNEEKVIGAKLLNTLDLDYPQEKLSVVVVSDGSSDRTDEIVRTFTGRSVQLVRPPERRGKTAGLNLALMEVKSEIVIFSDANAIYDRFAVRRLVRHFSDDKVGYVVGYARYENTADTAAGNSEGAYWDLEVKVKKWESAFSSVVGGDGAIYAIRSFLYEPLEETDINDFVNPLQIVAKGYRGIFDMEAWCREQTAGEFKKEFNRKARIVNRSFNGLFRVPPVLNPLKVGRFAWQVISHKLLKWFSPFIMGAHFIISLSVAKMTITGLAAFFVILLYLLLFMLSVVGWWNRNSEHENAAFYLPYYFILINIAAVVGIVKRLRGKTISTWSTVREKTSTN